MNTMQHNDVFILPWHDEIAFNGQRRQYQIRIALYARERAFGCSYWPTILADDDELNGNWIFCNFASRGSSRSVFNTSLLLVIIVK